MIQNSRL